MAGWGEGMHRTVTPEAAGIPGVSEPHLPSVRPRKLYHSGGLWSLHFLSQGLRQPCLRHV